ncbi:MAG: DNA-binding protein [Thermoplasmata archaeon]|nr:DNA-binding protein [Thermoplasmata archaeon]
MFVRENNIVVAKFVEGDIIDNLTSFAEEEGIKSGIILNGVGMLENAVIGYFDGEKYIKAEIKEPAELVSLQGNIGNDGEKAVIHAHVALACMDHLLRGGHLLGGKVRVVNEISLLILDKAEIKRVKKGNLMEMELSSHGNPGNEK